MELGGDFGQGDPPADWTRGSHAMEQPDIKLAVERFASSVWSRSRFRPDPTRVEDALLEHKSSMRRELRRWPTYVKAPLLGPSLFAWRRAGLRPSGIIIVHRDAGAVVESIRRYNGGIYGPVGRLGPSPLAEDRIDLLFGVTVAQALEANVPLSLVEFPRCVSVSPEDHQELYFGLYPNLPRCGCAITDFLEVYDRVADPRLIHIH